MSNNTTFSGYPDPTPEMLGTPEFNAIWKVIKDWDVKTHDGMRMGCTGNHVRAILEALWKVRNEEAIKRGIEIHKRIEEELARGEQPAFKVFLGGIQDRLESKTQEKPSLRNFQVLFRDSSEYFTVENARMFNEAGLVRFVKFTEDGEYIEDVYFPLVNIYRIKTL